MKKILVLAFVLLLMGCEKATVESLQEEIDSLGTTPRDVLNQIGNGYGLQRNYSVAVYDDRIVAKNSEEEYTIDLSSEQFYFAVAPYIENTHP